MLESVPDLTDPRLYSHGNPHAVWRRLRPEHPVFWHERPGKSGFWAVIAHEPAQRVLTDWRNFTSTRGTVLRHDLTAPYPGAGRMLVSLDPPRHNHHRKALAALFAPRAIAGLEGRSRDAIRSLLTAAVSAGYCDFVSDIAGRLPLAVVAGLLGIHADDLELLSSATTQVGQRADDIEGSASQEAHRAIMQYYLKVLELRRRQPRNDLVSALIAAQRDGLDLTDEELILTCDNVVVAASQTTKNAAATGLLAILDRPGQWQALRRGQFDLSSAVEEVLRWTAPATHVLRVATADLTLNGTALEEGDAVAVWIAAANRDERVFEDANELRLDRDVNPHLTFGAGVHFCLGARVARLTLRLLFEELIDRTNEITVTGEARRVGSWASGGLSTLPLRIT